MYLFRINKKKVVLRVCGKKKKKKNLNKKKKTTRLSHVFILCFLLFYFSDDVCMYMTISECVCMCVINTVYLVFSKMEKWKMSWFDSFLLFTL